MARLQEVSVGTLIDARIVTDQIPGETIPIRLFLGGFDLTPTFREVNKKYSTRYYLSLVLIDEGSLLRHCSSGGKLTHIRCTTVLQAVRDRTLPPSPRGVDIGAGAE